MQLTVTPRAAGVRQWPFDLGRVQLAYGEQLRRAHATAAARVQLVAARDAFEQLGARPWAERAATELRAAGGGRDATPAVTLTAQETVSTHLYRIFPKLGITSRAALRDALAMVPRPAR
jgi:hypothetical protein